MTVLGATVKQHSKKIVLGDTVTTQQKDSAPTMKVCSSTQALAIAHMNLIQAV